MWCFSVEECAENENSDVTIHASLNKALLRFQGIVDNQQLLDYGWICSLAPKVAKKITNEPDVDAVFAWAKATLQTMKILADIIHHRQDH